MGELFCSIGQCSRQEFGWMPDGRRVKHDHQSQTSKGAKDAEAFICSRCTSILVRAGAQEIPWESGVIPEIRDGKLVLRPTLKRRRVEDERGSVSVGD